MSALQWANVEREKGFLRIDPRTDSAITEAVQHGIEVVLVLDKGNWVRAPSPRVPQPNRELVETYFNLPRRPDPAAHAGYFAAWLEYVRFMVRHFRDRVRYFEIWNEWTVAPEHTREYCRLAEPTARVIREEHPQAKIAARFMTTNVALGIPSFWNETFQTHMTSPDVSLLRNTFSADPISPAQPQPVYDVLRTLATALGDVRPSDARITFAPGHPDLERYALERHGGELLVAAWLAGEAVDDASRAHTLDLTIDSAKGRSISAIDTLNGRRHGLALSGDGVTLEGTTLRDWPLVIVVSGA